MWALRGFGGLAGGEYDHDRSLDLAVQLAPSYAYGEATAPSYALRMAQISYGDEEAGEVEEGGVGYVDSASEEERRDREEAFGVEYNPDPAWQVRRWQMGYSDEAEEEEGEMIMDWRRGYEEDEDEEGGPVLAELKPLLEQEGSAAVAIENASLAVAEEDASEEDASVARRLEVGAKGSGAKGKGKGKGAGGKGSGAKGSGGKGSGGKGVGAKGSGGKGKGGGAAPGSAPRPTSAEAGNWTVRV